MARRFFSSSSLALTCGLAALVSAATGCDFLAALANSELSPTATPAEPAAPAPISGGTLFVTADQSRAVAADSEHDKVFVIDLSTQAIAYEIALEDGDEPGRVVGGPAGTALVALRNGGAVVSIDLATGTTHRRDVCPAPRGLAYDETANVVHVACSGGELVTLPASLDGPNVRELRLDRDLRDVIVQGDRLLVSRFRAADILVLDANGKVERRFEPGAYTSPTGRTFEPSVAYRMASAPGGKVVLVHQRSYAGVIPTGPSKTPGTTYYGGPCDSTVVHSAVSTFDVSLDKSVTLYGKGGIGNITLPVDVAVSLDGRIAVAGAGIDSVVEMSLAQTATSDEIDRCSGSAGTVTADPPRPHAISNPVAVTFGADGSLYVQSRDHLLTTIGADGVTTDEVAYPETPRLHTGHSLFHRAVGGTNGPIACASCHPEGGDDGRVWRFETLGEFRTQSMRGGVLDTLPLHWEGDMATFDDLLKEVMVNRMGGAMPDDHGKTALADWVQSVQDLPASAPLDAASAERGNKLFHDPAVGCATCHSGPRLTSGATVEVGTGRPLQVPSLVGVADRLPLMHTGCAETLFDRFDPACGGGDKHGTTSQLSDAEIVDLVAYLETL
jgi:mono/diheme cytochrome c family protein